MPGSAILCASVRSSHSCSTLTKKLRMSASSTQFTALPHDSRMQRTPGHVRVSQGAEAAGEPDKAGLAKRRSAPLDRTEDDFVLQRRHAERPLAAIGPGDVGSMTHRTDCGR